MVSNATMKKMFDDFGQRICGISLNNGKFIYVGYRGSTTIKLEDISFETVGGCDMIVINKTDISSGKPIKYKNYITTEFVESVIVMDEEFVDYRVDPVVLK